MAKSPASDTQAIEGFKDRIRELEDRLGQATEALEAVARGDIDALVMLDAAAQRHSQTIGRADRTYRIVMEQIREGALTMNTDGRILYSNGRLLRMLDAERDAVVGRQVQDFIQPDDQARFEQFLEKSRDDSVDGEFTLLGGAGAGIPVSCSLHPYGRVQGDRLLCGVVTDLTERNANLRALEAVRAERDALEEALRQSQKMAAVGQFTGGLAHDFNNLLAVIMGSLEMMRSDPGSLQEHWAAAIGSARRGAALTQRLMAFSRRQPPAPRRRAVNPVVEEIADLARNAVGPGIAVRLALAPDAGATLCDAHQLENAVLNLAINARDAMPAGGTLTISTARVPREAGDQVAVAVSDTGTGMPAEVIARAFDPFFTTKPVGQGTGLGLSMIQGFAQQSGGEVRIDSVEGAGTTVTIYLPRSQAAEEPDAPATRREAARGAAGVAAGETILLVDDEPEWRVLVGRFLRRHGFVVLEAGDGEAALAALRGADRVDLLVTDVGLPGGLGGHELAAAGREIRHDLKVLFITGFAESPDDAETALRAGGEVMHKPFEIEALASKIRAMVGIAPVA